MNKHLFNTPPLCYAGLVVDHKRRVDDQDVDMWSMRLRMMSTEHKATSASSKSFAQDLSDLIGLLIHNRK